MATPENMAEGTSGRGTEGRSLNQSGQVLSQHLTLKESISAIPIKERWKITAALPRSEIGTTTRLLGLEIRGGALDYLEAAAKQTSEFEDANEIVVLDSKLTATQRARVIADHPEFATILENSKRIRGDKLGSWETSTADPDEQRRRQELLAKRNQVLNYVIDDIRRIYVEASARPASRADSESWYSPNPTPKTLDERLKDVQNVLGKDKDPQTNKYKYNYKEVFWDYGQATLRTLSKAFPGLTPEGLSAIRAEYEGLASYAASEVAIAIDKELKGQPLERGRFGDDLLLEIKRELDETRGDRERARREERRRATAEERLHYNNWREKFDFTWAETPEELDDSIEDWLDFFQQQLPYEAEEAVYQEVTKGLTNVLASLEQARNRIGLEANSVVAQTLREKIVGHVTTIAGARLLESRGGFEYYIKLRKDFAANYNGHYDGIYLKKGSAVMSDQLSENDGEIYRGGPEDKNKPLAGDTKTFRSNLEREAIIYGAAHDLYITGDDFKTAELGEREIVKEVARLNLSFETSQKIIKQRLAERRKAIEIVGKYDFETAELDEKDIRQDVAKLNLSEADRVIVFRQRIAERREARSRGGRYSWEDGIEELLLVDSRGLAKAQVITDPQKRAEAIARVKARTGVFRKIKVMFDKEDDLFGKTPEERRNIIRQKIWDKITQEGNTVLLDAIARMPDQISRDRALWKWVEKYNKPRLEFRQEGSNQEPWFPSLWDMERLSIQKPEDLIDRALTKDQFKAMIEEIEDSYKGLTNEQVERQIENESTRQFQREAKAKGLPSEQVKIEVERMKLEKRDAIKRRIGDVLFERKQRQARTIRNYNISVALDKFLGLQARWGGLTTRHIGENGEIEMKTIFSLAGNILKAKVDKEESDIKDKVDQLMTQLVVSNPGLTAEQIDNLRIKQTRLLRRNATFAATLGLREIGIAKDLPIWNYFYYGDVSQIGAFAPLVGYTEDEKSLLTELLDRGRREMEAVFNFLTNVHMEGRLLVVKDEPYLKIEDADGNQKQAHEESGVRPRVINEGGVLKLRDLFEARTMLSTSGGVKVPDMIAKIADLGIYDELWENGCKDKREWQGFRKRRNKWELRKQSFLNTREWGDPITYVNRLAGAAAARRFLVGGEVQGQGRVPGLFNEPYDGLWQYRSELLEENAWKTSGPASIVKHQGPDWQQKLQELLDKDETIKLLNQKEIDRLAKVGGGILKNLISFMDSRDYVRNRASYAPKNWLYDNELIIRAFLKEASKRKPVIAKKGDILPNDQIAKGGELISAVGGEALGMDHLAYAIQGRSELANALFKAILQASSYHTLDEADRRALDGKAQVTKEKMDKKRKDLMKEILPETAQTAIDEQKNKLEEWTQREKAVLEQFNKIQIAGNVTPEHREEYGVQLDEINKGRRKLEVEIAVMTNQTVEAELDRQFNAGDLTNQTLRTMIAGRKHNLTALNVTSENLAMEINRLINLYVDTQLHKQFVGEWPTRLIS